MGHHRGGYHSTTVILSWSWCVDDATTLSFYQVYILIIYSDPRERLSLETFERPHTKPSKKKVQRS